MQAWLFRLIALAVIALSLLTKFMIPFGWFMIIGMVCYPIAGLFHFLVHSVTVGRAKVVGRPLLILIIISHLLFILAFLLQYDAGDSSHGDLTITYWFGHQAPAWWNSAPWMNLVVFIPVMVAWCMLLGNSTSNPSKTPQQTNSRFALFVWSILLSILGLALCGIPFMPPSVFLVVPTAAISLLLLALAFREWAVPSLPRLIAAGFSVVMNLFSLYLVLSGSHLIDWLENL
jgi:hypothetical protein